MKKRSGIAPLIAIGGILLALSVGSFFLTPTGHSRRTRTAICS